MKIRDLITWCDPRNACDPALEWLRTLDPDADAAVAWDTCTRADWMLWACAEAFGSYTPAMRFAVVEGVRKIALPHAGAHRDICETTLTVAERYARGEATKEELAAAWAAASDAARDATSDAAMNAAWAAGDTTSDAASDAEWGASAVAADAANAAGDAAGDAAWAAGDAEWEAAWDAAWDAAMDSFADIVRAHITWGDIEGAAT